MPFAKSFSVIALSALALLVSAGVASAQTYSYPSSGSTGSTGSSGSSLSGTVVSPSTQTTQHSSMTGQTGSAATTLNAVNSGQRVVNVGIFDSFFDPHNVVITQGSTVTWTNKGTMTHTVTADDGSFNSGALSPGGTYSHIFNTPGTYVYHCQFHGAVGGVGMFGVIVVMAPSTNTNTGSMLGASTATPNLPNTGAGGMAGVNVLALGLTGGMMLLGIFLLLRRRFAI